MNSNQREIAGGMFLAIVAAFLVCVVAFLSAGCTPPYRQQFLDEGNAKGWTEKEKLAAFAYADKIFWSREAGENHYVIMYNKVPTAIVRERLEAVLKDFNAILDPKDEELRKYLDNFKLRGDMEHDELVTQAIYGRVRAAELDAEFKEKMGESSSYGEEAVMAKGYNIRKIFLAKDLEQVFPFKSDQIEAAKKSGLLKPIEKLELDESIQFDHKEADPTHPDDIHEFVWVAKHQSIRLTNYKILDAEKPENNHGNYIEGYRVSEGKQEDKPALKIFFPDDGTLAVVLVDTDRQGDPGFGMPDVLDCVYGLDHVQDVIKDGKLLSMLFQKQNEKRVMPKDKVFSVEISPLDKPVDVWEKASSADGWIVPFKFRSDKGDNYSINLKFKKPKFNPDDAESMAKMHSDYQDIDWISKEYEGAGNVVEYYRPKKEFSTNIEAIVADKEVSFDFPDGSEITGHIPVGHNKFLEDAPYAMSYTEGQHRWWIEKSEGSSVYDKRKAMTPSRTAPSVAYDARTPANGDDDDLRGSQKPKL